MPRFSYLTSLMEKNDHCRKVFTRVAEWESKDDEHKPKEDESPQTMRIVGESEVLPSRNEGVLLHWKKVVRLKFEEETAKAAKQLEFENVEDALDWVKNWEMGSILRKSPPVDEPSSSAARDDAIQCPICEQIFETRRQLNQHKRLEHFPSWEGGNKEFCYLPYFVEPKRFSLLRGTLSSGQKECGLCEKWLSGEVRKKVGPYLENLRAKAKEETAEKSGTKKHPAETISSTRGIGKRRGRKCKAMAKRVCELCSKVLSNRKGLERHMLIHTGEKPFPCDICGKPFRRKDNCVRHKKTAHLFKKPRKPRRRKVAIVPGNSVPVTNP